MFRRHFRHVGIHARLSGRGEGVPRLVDRGRAPALAVHARAGVWARAGRTHLRDKGPADRVSCFGARFGALHLGRGLLEYLCCTALHAVFRWVFRIASLSCRWGNEC